MMRIMQFQLFPIDQPDSAPPPLVEDPARRRTDRVPTTWRAARRALIERPGGHVYLEPLASISAAAREHSLSPPDLATGGFDKLVAERRWRPATQALYSSVCNYTGIPVERVLVPRPQPVAGLLSWLTVPAGEGDGQGLRAVAWLSTAAAWPASLDRWSRLKLVELDVTGAAVRVDGRLIRGIGGPWLAWMRWRDAQPELRGSAYALCALRSGRTAGSGPGTALARRSLEAAFRHHARRCAGAARDAGVPSAAVLEALTYDTYRRAAIEHGAEPVDRGQGVGRLARPDEGSSLRRVPGGPRHG